MTILLVSSCLSALEPQKRFVHEGVYAVNIGALERTNHSSCDPSPPPQSVGPCLSWKALKRRWTVTQVEFHILAAMSSTYTFTLAPSKQIRHQLPNLQI